MLKFRLPHFSFGRKPVEKVNIRRSIYDAANNDRLNDEQFKDAKHFEVNNEIVMSREVLAQRSIQEEARNPSFAGIVETHRTDIVGPSGPSLQLSSANEEYCARRAAIFEQWAKMPDAGGRMTLTQMLRLAVNMGWFHGEVLFQLVSSPAFGGPIKLRLRALDPSRMRTPANRAFEKNVGMGMRLDDFGAAVSYFFSELEHMGDSFYESMRFREIPARDIIHVFEQKFADQYRGIPWGATALQIMADLRSADRSVRDAIRFAAQWGAMVLEQESVGGDPVEFEGDVALERMTAKVLPPGIKAHQIEAGHPSDNYVEYRHEMLGDMGAPVNMPRILVRKDSGLANFSSARLDIGIYGRSVGCKRFDLRDKVLDRIESAVAYEAELSGMLPAEPADLVKEWTWPDLASVDPLKDAQTIEQEMINGTLDFGTACRRMNLDPEKVIAAAAKYAKAREDAGLEPIPFFQDKSQQPAAGDVAAGDTPKKKTDAKKKAAGRVVEMISGGQNR